MRVLITQTDLNDPGGITAHFRKLAKYFAVDVEPFIVGRRPEERGFWARLWRFSRDAFGLRARLLAGGVDVVHVNPSLDWKSLMRDGLSVRIAHALGVPVLVFFHGWPPANADAIERRFLWLFRFLFCHASALVCLSSTIEATLRRWGFNQPIHREVTVLDDDEASSVDIECLLQTRAESSAWPVLFLSRILKTKGIYEALDAVSQFHERHPEVEFIVAGDGSELDRAKAYAADHAMTWVRFPGYVQGAIKRQTFESARVFLLPSYSEGIPGAMIEAMAYGLPVITRRVGGIPDILSDEQHGLTTDSLEPSVFVELLEYFIDNERRYKAVSRTNVQYVRERFLASDAAKRLESIYQEVCTT